MRASGFWARRRRLEVPLEPGPLALLSLPSGPHSESMFVYYFVPLDLGPFWRVEWAFVEVLDTLPEAADFAYRRGEEVRVRLSVDGGPAAKEVRLAVGEPFRGDDQTAAPITWEATGTPGLFPRMEADLLVTSLGPDLTHLALRGSYKPPLGPVGAALDRMILHRVAELSVKVFVDRLATLLSERMAEIGTSGHEED